VYLLFISYSGSAVDLMLQFLSPCGTVLWSWGRPKCLCPYA